MDLNCEFHESCAKCWVKLSELPQVESFESKRLKKDEDLDSGLGDSPPLTPLSPSSEGTNGKCYATKIKP